MTPLTSAQNPLIKHLIKLRENRSYRYSQGSIFIEGKKLIQEITKFCSPIHLFATSPELLNFLPITNISPDSSFLISPSIQKKLSNTLSPEGLFAEVPMPSLVSSLKSWEKKKRILILENINDPGNLGTLFRSALAFGWKAIYLITPCCDPFNEKALRAAKGATFHLELASGTWKTIKEFLDATQKKILIADIKGETPNSNIINRDKPFALVLGNEAKGVLNTTKHNQTCITLPISEQVESLNVATAGSILMYLTQ